MKGVETKWLSWITVQLVLMFAKLWSNEMFQLVNSASWRQRKQKRIFSMTNLYENPQSSNYYSLKGRICEKEKLRERKILVWGAAECYAINFVLKRKNEIAWKVSKKWSSERKDFLIFDLSWLYLQGRKCLLYNK